MKNINPLNCIDFYKADHRRQYPEGTTMVFSNFTPRSARHANVPVDKIVFFGLKYFIKHFLIEVWDEGFFKKPKAEVVAEYKRRLDTSLGPDAVPVDHIEALHDLGYLPIQINALPELTEVPMRVPCLTIYNTASEFFWLVNYIETVLSAYLWLPCTSATTAKYYRTLLEDAAEKTGSPKEFVDFQAHDFSFRGMGSLQAAAISGAAHLQFFKGTDSVIAIDLLEQYYGKGEGYSVPATEHSVMCMGGEQLEIETFRRLIVDLYPKGIVSIVSDTWDFWKVISEYSLTLHREIMAREGKVVFRPDSGDPVKIICGDPSAPERTLARKGAVEVLWEIFGGIYTSTGHKVLDEHVGLIYGDSITPSIAKDILDGLAAKGFASCNIVLGVGSYTYQYVTRDTWGFAVKATYGEINYKPRNIQKSPKTDDGVKNSAKGLLAVVRDADGNLALKEEVSWGEFKGDDNLLKTVFEDGGTTA